MLCMVGLLVALLMFDSPSPPPLTTPPLVSPSPQTTLLPGWASAPIDNSLEYAHYIRHEPDGTDSDISATRQVCDCQPDHAMQMLWDAFKSIRGASIQQSSIVECGEQADRLIVTGTADKSNEFRNIEVVMFRVEPALFTLTYSFRYAAPMADAEEALTSICPASAES
jgi:hypothetical protein